MRSKSPWPAWCLALMLMAALFAGGCGDGGGESNGGERQPSFDATRMPGIGSVYEYYANAALPGDSQGIPVSFALEREWYFASGPDEVTVEVSQISPEGMPGAEMFPGANLCFMSEVSGSVSYSYYLQDDMARRIMGSYVASGEGEGFWNRYDPPKTVLRFPLELPACKPVPESLTYTSRDGLPQSISSLSTVRWIDTVTVPAGEFPGSAMVQYFDVYTSEDGTYSELSYAWYAPDVGQVAFLRAFPDETQPAFRQAADFRRLASCQAVK